MIRASTDLARLGQGGFTFFGGWYSCHPRVVLSSRPDSRVVVRGRPDRYVSPLPQKSFSRRTHTADVPRRGDARTAHLSLFNPRPSSQGRMQIFEGQ